PDASFLVARSVFSPVKRPTKQNLWWPEVPQNNGRRASESRTISEVGCSLALLSQLTKETAMNVQHTKALRTAPLETPTDLKPEGVRDIAGALNILLAD